LDNLSTEWSPTKLPPLEPSRKPGRKTPHFAQAVAEVIFGWLFLFWLLLVPKYPFLMFGPGEIYFRSGPFALAPVWITAYWVVLAFNFGQVLWNTMDLVSGAWRTPSPIKPLFFKAGGLVSTGVLLFAANSVYAVLKHPETAEPKYSAMLNQINPSLHIALMVVFLMVAIQFAWDLIQWIREPKKHTSVSCI
jgi:hypothetical protein